MSAVWGDVKGNQCPDCREHVELEGDFHTGMEVECVCGVTLVIQEVQAVYTVKLDVAVDKPND